MTTFQVTAKYVGEPINLRWSNGALTGNGSAIRLVLLEAEKNEGLPVGPIGQQTTTKHLSDPLSALTLISVVFPDAEFFGEIPVAEGAPEGAIL